MDGRMPKITVDRTPSDESLASSCAQMSLTSPGSSSSPRSPISPPWSSTNGARSPSKIYQRPKGCSKEPGLFQTLQLATVLSSPETEMDRRVVQTLLQEIAMVRGSTLQSMPVEPLAASTMPTMCITWIKWRIFSTSNSNKSFKLTKYVLGGELCWPYLKWGSIVSSENCIKVKPNRVLQLAQSVAKMLTLASFSLGEWETYLKAMHTVVSH